MSTFQPEDPHPLDERHFQGDDGKEWPNHPMPAEYAVEAGLMKPGEVEVSGYTPEAPKATEEELLTLRVRRGEQGAIKELYRLYAPTLMRRILRLLGGDMAQAEDCLQQVFVKALQSIRSYRGEGALLAWLNRITTHAVMDVFRAQQGRRKMLEKLTSFRLVGWGNDGNQAIPEKLFLQEELRDMLHQGLNSLGKDKRMAVLLCDWEGYAIEEAAVELEIPIGTIASRLYRGRQELRAWMKREMKKQGLIAEEWLHG